MIEPMTSDVLHHVNERAKDKLESAGVDPNVSPYYDEWQRRYTGDRLESNAEHWTVAFAESVFKEFQDYIKHLEGVVATGLGANLTKKLRQAEKENGEMRQALGLIHHQTARYRND